MVCWKCPAGSGIAAFSGSIHFLPSAQCDSETWYNLEKNRIASHFSAFLLTLIPHLIWSPDTVSPRPPLCHFGSTASLNLCTRHLQGWGAAHKTSGYDSMLDIRIIFQHDFEMDETWIWTWWEPEEDNRWIEMSNVELKTYRFPAAICSCGCIMKM